jgi:MFS family permease
MCAVVNGAASAFDRPASFGILPQIVSASRVQQANALMGLNSRLVGIVGAALGSWLVNSVGAGYALAFDSSTFLVAGVLLLTVAKDAPPLKRESSPLVDFREGWQEVRSRSWLWSLILSFGVFQLAYFPALMVLGPDIARKHLGGAAAWAAIITGELIGGIIGGLVSLKIHAKRPLLLTLFAVVPVVLQLIGFALGWPLAALIACTAFASIGFAIGGTIWSSTLQKLIPTDALSRVSSFDWLGSIALNPIGYALIGPLSAVLGERETMGYAAVLLSLSIFLPMTIPAVRALRIP